ncbi:MAG TPA: cytochrome c [Candidatus Angelobacter sp.]|nr:cytochrome c [Candidatus Angelobacter sp.]
MKLKACISVLVLGMAVCLAVIAGAKAGDGKGNDKDSPAAAASASHAPQDDPMRLEGEKRFHSNCGRCHSAPRKFPPRMMATIVRHMRVRATITDEDMRLILHYMTQ